MVHTNSEQMAGDVGTVSIEMDDFEESCEATVTSQTDPLPFEEILDRPPRVMGPIEIETLTRSGRRRFMVRDISLTGLYIPGATAPVGREVPLRIPLPGEQAPLEVAARVVRCDEDPERGLGLTFSRIGWEDLLSLARYLAPRL